MAELEGPHARLRAALDRRGLTAAELARALDVSQPTVHAWLHGLHGLRWGNAQRVAEALGTTAAWLMFGTTQEDRTAQTGDELAVLRLYRKLGDEGRAEVLREMRRRVRRG